MLPLLLLSLLAVRGYSIADAANPKGDQTRAMPARSLPNVLWILTDDQRYDSIRAFNRILHDRDHGELGYVESPRVDRLVAMGTTFINTYCQAMGCAPSRASMHYGRYPFRSGIYEFEYHNNNAGHTRPTLPESMASLGYQTLHVGKLGVRIKTRRQGWTQTHQIYQTDIDFRTLSREGLCDWGKDWISQINGEKLPQPFQGLEFFVTPEGKFEYCSLELEKMKPEFAGTTAATIGKYDLLRHFNAKKGKAIDKGMIIAGVSPQPAGKTRDGYYSSVFADCLKNANRKFKVGTKTFDGVDTSKPLFAHIGYDFPHTPVLPPADYRARFQRHHYRIPQVDPRELQNMPEQLKRQVAFGQSDHLTDAQKLTMIRDYYAFCAYGDALVGQAVDAFVEYSNQQKQPWMIVYVCGDHGWKLNEHGAVSKFTPWKLDSHNPIVVVSSDKQAFPAGKVVTDFTEFVDIAPTILAAGGARLRDKQYAHLDGRDLAEVASGKVPARDYVIGESHAVTGPRAYIRTKEYAFSMQTRPDRTRGKNMLWAMNADYEELDPALYHMPTDPYEVNNLAFSNKHRRIADALRDKLLNIVLGDNRVEVDWGPKADGTNVYHSNFAPGAHDGKLGALFSGKRQAATRIVLSSEIQWEQLNPARGDASPQAGTLWGDRNGIEPTGFLAKFVDGFSSPPHIHNVTYRAVVISGSIHNDDPEADERWMPAGSFWTQPKGQVHITSAKGATNIALVEIDHGPYRVLPIEMAFDKGEQPVKVDPSNLVWVDPPGFDASDDGPKIARLWGNIQKGHSHGSFVRLPAGFSGEIHSQGSTFRAVVIKGHPVYHGLRTTELDAGSHFSSEDASIHRISSSRGVASILYIRASNPYQIVQKIGTRTSDE